MVQSNVTRADAAGLAKAALATAILGPMALTPTHSAAEVVRFTAFTEAFNGLLDIDNALVGGGADTARGGSPNTNCDPRFLAGGEDGLSRTLRFLCFDRSNNSSAGTALGGGLFSFQPTRTVSQFAARRGRAPSGAPAASAGAAGVDGSATGQFTTAAFVGDQFFGASSDFAGAAEFGEAVLGVLSFDGSETGEGALRWTEDRWSVIVRAEYAREEREATIYAPASESDTAQTSIAVAYRFTDAFLGGVSGYFSYADTVTDRHDVLTEFDGETATDAFYEATCGVPTEGEAASRAVGIGAFGAWRGQELAAAPFVAGEVVLSVSDTAYQRSLCYSSDFQLADFEEHAGVIFGDALRYEASADVTGGFDVHFGRLAIGPRVGGDVRFALTPAFTETEVQSAVTEYASGGALAFEQHDTLRVRGRIGLAAATEFDLSGRRIEPFFEGAFIYELVPDDTRVTARFAGDERDDPLTFSFLTGDQDPAYFELATGVAVSLNGGGRIVVNGRTTLGDEDLGASYGLSTDIVLPLN